MMQVIEGKLAHRLDHNGNFALAVSQLLKIVYQTHNHDSTCSERCDTEKDYLC